MTRNVFEDNEPPEINPEDLDEEMVVAVLPRLAEGHHYNLKDLFNGETAVEVLKNDHMKADDLDSPESRTLRHRD